MQRRSPDLTSFDPVGLERGRTHDADFEQCANKVWNLGSGLGSEVSLRDFRKDMTIELYNEAGQKVMAFTVSAAGPPSTWRSASSRRTGARWPSSR
jgi:phage tail-like protein